jgi:hypothetical protein
MEKSRKQPAAIPWLRWALMTGVGWFVGFFGGFVIAGALEPIVGSGPIQSVVAYAWLGSCLGAGVGLMQWLVLRRSIAGTAAWIGASAVGMGLAGGAGYGVAVLLFGYSEELEDLSSATSVAGWMLAAAFGGIVTGVLQRRVLSPHLPNAGRWVAASAVTWALSIAALGSMGLLATYLAPEASPVGAGWFFAGLIAGGLVLGASSGGVMARLSHPPAADGGSRRG